MSKPDPYAEPFGEVTYFVQPRVYTLAEDMPFQWPQLRLSARTLGGAAAVMFAGAILAAFTLAQPPRAMLTNHPANVEATQAYTPGNR